MCKDFFSSSGGGGEVDKVVCDNKQTCWLPLAREHSHTCFAWHMSWTWWCSSFWLGTLASRMSCGRSACVGTLGGYTQQLFAWLNLSGNHLICDTPTCWNITLAMLQWLHQDQWNVNEFLCKYGMITGSGKLGTF